MTSRWWFNATDKERELQLTACHELGLDVDQAAKNLGAFSSWNIIEFANRKNLKFYFADPMRRDA
jgi:hypothetical protein